MWTPKTLRPMGAFIAGGIVIGTAFGVVANALLYFAAMGCAAGAAMGAAWIKIQRKKVA